MDEEDIPDRELYHPVFAPWLSSKYQKIYAVAAARQTLVSSERIYVLHTLLQQALHIPGDVWECGVYRGGTATMLAASIVEASSRKLLYLFDTFQGMPSSDPARDVHKEGDLEADLVDVAAAINQPGICRFKPGLIPDTFAGLEDRRIAFAHVDLDLYRSTLDALTFIWPRLSMGGMMVIDDYGFPSCPGARAAVDEFFAAEKCRPLCLASGQAILFKGIGVVQATQL